MKLLDRKDIDVEKWNDTIKKSCQPRIYAYSWYLDSMTDCSWSALVEGDYGSVFPILIKKIGFVSYVTQPYLCQQLGLFTTYKENIESHSNKIIKYLKSNFLKTDTTINNLFPLQKRTSLRTNQILNLNRDYTNIYKNYNRNTKRNINKAIEERLTIDVSNNISYFIDFIVSNDETGIVRKIKQHIHQLIDTSFQKRNGTIIVAKDESGLHSGAFYIKDKDRIYFLLCASDKSGIDKKAMFLIIDEIIRRYAGNNFILDFTGSNIENISRRNIGFGAETEIYFHLKLLWSPL